MKKSILIALAVALTTGAQGQSELGDNPTEYVNPFESLGAFDYIQKQSDGKCGKWFLSGKNAEDRYFTTEGTNDNYTTVGRAAKIIVNKDGNYENVQFCIVLDVSEKFKNVNDKYIDISYKIGSSNNFMDYYLVVESEMNHDFKSKTDLSSFLNNNENNNTILLKENYYNSERIETTIQTKTNGNYLYLHFNLGKNAGIYYIERIKINGYTYDNNNKRINCFNEEYFNLSLYLIDFDSNGGSEINDMFFLETFKDNHGFKEYEHYIVDENLNIMAILNHDWNWVDGCYPNPTRNGHEFKGWFLGENIYNFESVFNDITLTAQWEKIDGYVEEETITSITNTMESNIYVSNNVLHTDEPSSVYIFNAGGILVKTENNTTSVDLSDLKKGVYIAKVNEKTIKFVR